MESKVIFKSVGQGDSIVLESKIGDEYRIGIIDCRLHNRVNEIVDYLSGLEKYEVEFILISHAHADHYDGIIGLLEYLHNHKDGKKIFCLYHTHWLSGAFREFFRNMPLPEKMVNDFDKLLLGIKHYKTLGLIETEKDLVDGSGIFFNNQSIYISGLSPSFEEKDLFIRYLSRYVKKNVPIPKTNSYANLFSSVCLIFVHGSRDYIFLCADAEKITFRRLVKTLDTKGFIENYGQAIAAQIPHHGAKRNYYKAFWEKIKKTSPNMKAVISVGENHYDHPSVDVLADLITLGYIVNVTEKMSETYMENLRHNHKIRNTFKDLDWISRLADDGLDVAFPLSN